MHVSLDGFVAGPNGEIDWIFLDDEMFEDVHDLVSKADTALFGRVTYHIMEDYWPTAANRPGATKHDREHSSWLSLASKIVFSRTLKKVNWHYTRIVNGRVSEEIAELKKQPGKNLILFASPGLASTFMNLNLIDEYWFNVNPILLGEGIPLFKNLSDMRTLKLLDSKTYKQGVVNLHYGRTDS